MAGVKRKVPYYFKEKNHNLFAFAGVYSVIDDNSERPIYSASIITTEANKTFKEIHNKPNKLGSYRMPLILDPSNYWEWLHESEEKNIKELVNTFTNQEIVTYPVSQDLFSNKINTNTPSIIKEVPIQNGLF
ncbi:SOS response-associated peptidase family protein [Polaribacter sp.]|uniref:SOS response-associated peptidase family protein n=1 Tax=Polaribacter sp. TaxID=1920175 RepID=UPI004048D481